MGKCVCCGKDGDWLAICPDCFAEDLIDIDPKVRGQK